MVHRLAKQWKKIAIGAIAAVFLIGLAFTYIPRTPIAFSVVGEAVNPGETEQMGTRLFIGGEHIHHWMIGLALMIIALGASYYSALPTRLGSLLRIAGPAAGYIFGFGLILFLDQAPFLLGLQQFGV